jgi:hypothetical protein
MKSHYVDLDRFYVLVKQHFQFLVEAGCGRQLVNDRLNRQRKRWRTCVRAAG